MTKILRARWYGCAVFLLLSLLTPLLAVDAPRWQAVRGAGEFVATLAQDPRGIVWIGTEDKGVYRYDAKAAGPDQLTQFSTKDGLGDDNAYAVAVDKLGRVWVGHLNHGVSVYNGEKWRNYGVLDGPIGERIFAIAPCPTDGDVWMASSAGLARYSLKDDSWSYFSRADGLVEDQANALAFDSHGTIYVGTQCHGVAIAQASDGYKKWTVTAGPAELPLTPTGSGLPTSLINGLAVTHDGTVYAATTAGLAWSKNKGKTWSYVRGRDYAAKVKGRIGAAPPDWTEPPQHLLDTLLPEDYVTCLAEDDAGLLWLGFRQHGYLAVDPKKNRHVFKGAKKADGIPDEYVSAVLPTADLRPLLGTYGFGVIQAVDALKAPGAKAKAPLAAKPPVSEAPPLPTPAKPPTLVELKAMLQKVQGLPTTKAIGAYLGEDWTTQGDWVGRYGRQSATLCAMSAPLDHELGWDADFLVGACLGPHRTPDDALRHWIHWVKTDNPRSLYTTAAGSRRQSEWDDHGEAYAQSFEGPDIWVSFIVPKGTHRIAFYLMNKDGHDGANRFRDYLLDLRGPARDFTTGQVAPLLARCRVRNFWGGVYKSWLVAGPGRYYVRMAKNGSLNTILSAVMMDRVLGPTQPWDSSWLPFMEKVHYEAPKPSIIDPGASAELTASFALWQSLNQVPAVTGGVRLWPAYRNLAYRTAAAELADPALLANWRWAMPIWAASDRNEWVEVMARARAVRQEIKRTGIHPVSE